MPAKTPNRPLQFFAIKALQTLAKAKPMSADSLLGYNGRWLVERGFAVKCGEVGVRKIASYEITELGRQHLRENFW